MTLIPPNFNWQDFHIVESPNFAGHGAGTAGDGALLTGPPLEEAPELPKLGEVIEVEPLDSPIPATQPDLPDLDLEETPRELQVESKSGDGGSLGTQHGKDGGLNFDQTIPPPPQLSVKAANQRLRRVMQPRSDGSFLVPECVREKWKDLATRSEVMAMFEKVAFEPAP